MFRSHLDPVVELASVPTVRGKDSMAQVWSVSVMYALNPAPQESLV